MFNSWNEIKEAQQIDALVEQHIIGECNENSQAEVEFRRIIKSNLEKNPYTPYYFHFNESIEKFGVPPRTVRVEEHEDGFSHFLSKQCNIGMIRAKRLLCYASGDLKTSSLTLDVGKTIDNKLVAEVELNDSQHYLIPKDEEKKAKAIRQFFCDYIKRMELNKIAPIIDIDMRDDNKYKIGSEKHLQQSTMAYEFVTTL